MIRPLKTGILLLALGAVFWLGELKGIGDASELRAINDQNAQHFDEWMAAARRAEDRSNKTSTEMVDCQGALATMNAVVVGLRAHYWPTGFDPLPTQSVRFWGVGHRPVTYKIPPPIQQGQNFDPDAHY